MTYMNLPVLPVAQTRLLLQFSRMAIESQMIIGIRLAGMMGLIAQAPGEPFRMVAEKHAAASESLLAMATAAGRGASAERVMSLGLRPYGKRTRANSQRLSRKSA
ncbi:MAG: antibiotic ABC transporter [Paracoccus sp. (in: a-proteobacteria)]